MKLNVASDQSAVAARPTGGSLAPECAPNIDRDSVMKWQKHEIEELLVRAIEGKEISDWDDLIKERESRDNFTRHWAGRAYQVEILFPRRHERELFGPEGLDYLRRVLRELENSSA